MLEKIKKYFPHFLLALYLVEFVIFAINPYDRSVWWAENIPVFTAVLVLVLTYRKFRFSNFTYFVMGFFLMFHTYGGHYTFELAPFGFMNSLFDKMDCSLFQAGRNNFDRVGHYMVGFFALPLMEITYKTGVIKKKWLAILFGIFALGFWGSLYEIIEMTYAIQEGGSSGAAFLGSQGDEWDAQKDMLLDILGALTMAVIFWFWKIKPKNKE